METWRSSMSEKVIPINKWKGYTKPKKSAEPIKTEAKIKQQWIAALVCAILNAEKIERSSSIVKRQPNI
jgi:hypothetical protein